MKVVNEAHVKMPQIGVREQKERERRLVVRWKCLFSHFLSLSLSLYAVCVFKINRPCDEQPVPCWKYILWNTTALCRNLAKRRLGSIELHLHHTVKLPEKCCFNSLRFQKMSLSSACVNLDTQTQIQPFCLGEKQPRNLLNQFCKRAPPQLHDTTGYNCLLCVLQLYKTVNHLWQDLCCYSGYIYICYVSFVVIFKEDNRMWNIQKMWLGIKCAFLMWQQI